MKKIFKFLLVVTILTAGITATQFITNNSTASASAYTNYPDGTGRVWNEQVITYLTNLGYQGVTVFYIDCYGNRSCHSTNHEGYHTIVFVSGGAIIGHQDVADND